MEWIKCKDRLPEIYETVIVEGGCAYWNGRLWMTKMECPNQPIEWEVKYWMPLPSLHEPKMITCGFCGSRVEEKKPDKVELPKELPDINREAICLIFKYLKQKDGK